MSFLREIEKHVAKNLEVHIIVENYHPQTSASPTLVRRATTIPRALPPAYAAWLNQVECRGLKIGTKLRLRGACPSYH